MAYQKKGSKNVKRIKAIARKAFGTQLKFCEQAGIRNGDFGTKLNLMDNRVDEFNKFLKQFDLKYKLVNIDEKESELSIENVISEFLKSKAKDHGIDIIDLSVSTFEDSLYIQERDGLVFDVVIKDIEEIKIK